MWFCKALSPKRFRRFSPSAYDYNNIGIIGISRTKTISITFKQACDRDEEQYNLDYFKTNVTF